MRVLLADDHLVFCESLASWLTSKGISVVGIVTNGEEALRKARELRPDVILMDIEMKGIDGIETTRKIKEACPHTKVIILTMHANDEYLFEAIKAGADAYILKELSTSFLLDTIQAVMEDEGITNVFTARKTLGRLRELLNEASEPRNRSGLTNKEIEILRLIAQGYTNKTIAEKLCLSQHTVRNHLVSIFSKLNCHSRSQAVAEAIRQRLL